MSDQDQPIPLDRAEYEEGPQAASACAACQTPLSGEYWTANAMVICTPCAGQLGQALQGGSGLARFVKAGVLGLLGGLVGAGIYFLVLKLTGYEVGLIAIAVGFLVGAGVRMGAEQRGGWLYQLMAVGMTYAAIVSTYVPFIVEGLSQGDDAIEGPAAWVVASVLAVPAPFLAGFQNVIGILIIGFALWQAFRMNSRRKIALSGPHALAAGTVPLPPAVPDANAPTA